jgi:bifunctional DNase/RNase
MIEMELSKILITETGEYQVVWLREKGGERTFPILIGIFEAAAIDRVVREIQTPRPLTHDLMASVIGSLDATLDRIIVSSLQSHTFYAKLILQKNGAAVELDSRPSDAIALAVRLGAPIFVEDDVLDHVCAGSDSPDGAAPMPPDGPAMA